ncbi:hypothetical protein ABEB36_002108 [Hypothenemus hampei]|uniref:Uncharacterized protein n=1 Tax=Hypothenemus hampei TaxID=57062 RepID=A0ABD1F7Q4_HYPHA
MINCTACGLSKTNKNKCSGISFYVKWMNFVKQPDWIPKAENCLSSKHFAPDYFDRTYLSMMKKL